MQNMISKEQAMDGRGKETIEDIVLRHSKRGMDVLRRYLPACYAAAAAKYILSWQKGRTVFLTTGFYVAGFAETDGPAGTVFLALALKKIGFRPVIITDSYCKGFFELKHIETLYMPFDYGENWCSEILAKYKPAGLISIERCGRNIHGDYENMRGVSISEFTAETDILFSLAYHKIPTVGVGDGGNEIGMGNLAEIISANLKLVPCEVKVDNLVIATVSNWGAYALGAYLAVFSGDMSLLPSFDEVREYIAQTVEIGSVDGVTKERKVGVDGFDMNTEKEILDALKDAVIQEIKNES